MNDWARWLRTAVLAFATIGLPGIVRAQPAAIDYGANFPIGVAPNLQTHSAIAYSVTDNRYLDVWQDSRNVKTNGLDVYGQVVNGDGSLFGSGLAISTASSDQTTPEIAWDSVNDQYLVVWADERNSATTGKDIYGQIIAGNGALIGGNFVISNAPKDQDRPQVAFDPQDQRYLVAWQDPRSGTGFETYAQLIDPNGNLIGGNFAIETLLHYKLPTRPRVGYDPTDNQFLVVWQDYRNYATNGVDLYGQFVAPAGTLIGGNFVISNAPGDQHRPTLAWDGADDEFLLSFADCRNSPTTCHENTGDEQYIGEQIYGQVINAANGSLIGGPIPIAVNSWPDVRPVTAWSSVSQTFLVAYTDYRNTPCCDYQNGLSGIFMQTIAPNGTLTGADIPVSNTVYGAARVEAAYNPTQDEMLLSYTYFLHGGDIYGQFINFINPTWSSFRHDPTDSGISPYVGPSNPTLSWAFKTNGPVWPSPALASDGTIYMAGEDGYVRALNPNGTQKWSFKTGAGIFSSPAVGPDGTVYIGSQDTYMYALSPVDGSMKWKFQTGAAIPAEPAVSFDGQEIMFGSNDGNLYVVDPNGNLIWFFNSGGQIAAKPAIGPGGVIYFGSNAPAVHQLYALSASGVQEWTFKAKQWIGAAPAVNQSDGTIYIGSWDDNMYALTPTGTLKWTVTAGFRIESSAAIGPDGTIYFGSADQNIYAVTPSGTVKWTYLTTGSPTSKCTLQPPLHIYCDEVEGSAAVDANGTIYIGSHDNFMYALNPDGSLQWRFQAGDQVNSSPTIGANGALYFGSRDKNFYALGGS